MFGVVDRYFLHEVSRVFLAIVGVLMLVVISMLFLRTLEEVNVGSLGADMVLRYLGLQILRDTASLLPPAFFLGILVALSRMARDSELIALNACGLGPWRTYRALLLLAIPLAAVVAWFSLVLQPWASEQIHKVRAMQKEQTYQIAGIQQGRFYQQSNGEVTFYVEKIMGKQRLQNVFIQDRREKQMRLVVSESGQHRFDEASGDHFVTLLAGRRYDGAPGAADYRIAEFDRYDVRIEPKEIEQVRSKRSALRTTELVGSEAIEDRVELQHRLASPVAMLTLALLAIPLIAVSPRQGTTGRMLLAFIAYFGFFNLQRLAENWMEIGVTPAWLGSLWYQVLMLALVYGVLLPNGSSIRRLARRAFPRHGADGRASGR